MNFWESTRSSYWFTPSVMCLAAVVGSALSLWLDRTLLAEGNSESSWFYTGSVEGARSLLSTIAGSLISVAGVTYSITIVALTLASNQFGPRLLRNFMRDLGNQIVLGTYLSAFLFSLLVLRQVHGGEGGEYRAFIPQVSILIAVLLAVLGVGVLIFFIHHIAASIQAPQVIATVADEFREAIDKLYLEENDETKDDEASLREELERQIPAAFERNAAEIRIDEGGYLQRIECNQLFDEAVNRDLVIQVACRPGQFLTAGDVVLRAFPAERVDAARRRDLRQTLAMGSQRAIGQDAEFAVDQLVEIALLALSPGVNDSFTAMMVVDRLGEVLSHMAERRPPSPYRTDEKGRLRLIDQPLAFTKMFDAAFTQIRQNSADNLAVMLRLFRAAAQIARRLHDPLRQNHLRRFISALYEQASNLSGAPQDREALLKQYQEAVEALGTDAEAKEEDAEHS